MSCFDSAENGFCNVINQMDDDGRWLRTKIAKFNEAKNCFVSAEMEFLNTLIKWTTMDDGCVLKLQSSSSAIESFVQQKIALSRQKWSF
jgi:hypothetical protein